MTASARLSRGRGGGDGVIDDGKRAPPGGSAEAVVAHGSEMSSWQLELTMDSAAGGPFVST